MAQTPEQVIDRQLAAYNAHDIDAFMETYGPTIQTLDFPTNKILDNGAEAVRAFFQ